MLSVTDFSGRVLSLPPETSHIWRALQPGIGVSLSRGPIPDPYAADVAYRKEPRIGAAGKRAEIWRPWWDVQAAGWGDCEDLSCWLASWLRQRGDTSAYIGLIEFPGGGWHAVTVSRRPPLSQAPGVYRAETVGQRYPGAQIYCAPGASPAGWWVYDVSYAHGMRDPSQGATYAAGVPEGQREPLDHLYRPGQDPYYSAGLSGVPDVIEQIPAWAWVAGLVGGAVVLGASSAEPITDAYLRSLPWSDTWLLLWGAPAARRMVEISRELGMPTPASLLAIIYHETGGSFDPGVTHPTSKATGLIQFMPGTARRLGTSVDALRRMSARDQLEYVRLYLLPGAPYPGGARDVYDYVFLPSRAKRADGILTYRGEVSKTGKLLRYYEGNRHLDIDGDGYIRQGEPGAVALADLARSGYGVGIVRSDDPPDVLAFRRNTSAGNAAYLLGQAAGRTYDAGLLQAIGRQIRFFSSLPPVQDVGEHEALVVQFLRQARGMTGSAATDPGLLATADHAWSAVKQTARIAAAKTGAAVEAAAAAAEQGISSVAQAGGTLAGVPVWVWALGAGAAGWWYLNRRHAQ